MPANWRITSVSAFTQAVVHTYIKSNVSGVLKVVLNAQLSTGKQCGVQVWYNDSRMISLLVLTSSWPELQFHMQLL